MYFCYFVIISPWKRWGPSFEQIWILIIDGCFMPRLVEIGPVVLKKMMIMWKTTDKLWSEKLTWAFGSGELISTLKYSVAPDFQSFNPTPNKQLDAPRFHNLLLKICALLLDIFGITVQNIGVLWLDVNVLEEMVVHKGMVTLWVISGKSYRDK